MAGSAPSDLRVAQEKFKHQTEHRLGLCRWSMSSTDEPSPGKWTAKDLEDSTRRVLRGRFICAVGCNGGRFIQRLSGIDKLYQSLRRIIVVTDLSQLPNEA